MIPIIDTHQHLWDLNRIRLPWIGPSHPLNRSHLMSDYLRETDAQGVIGTVFMEVDAAVEDQALEAEYAVDLCTRGDNPMLGAIISGRPNEDGFEDYLSSACGMDSGGHIKGVRQILHGEAPQGFALQPRFIESMRLLGERGLSFDLCMRPGELEDAARLASECPSTQFILDHCGNADVQAEDQTAWMRGIESVARQPNVACKISGIVVSARPGAWSAENLAPFVNHCADSFGPDRIVFGGDWPVCTLVAPLRDWITALREIIAGWPEDRQRMLLHENARRIYRLGDSA